MKALFLRLSVVALTLIVMVIGSELFIASQGRKFAELESVHTYSQFNVHYGIEPKPKLEYDEYGIKVRTNSDGTFGPEIEKDIPIILQLGDSYTAGPGIAYEKNYPFLLQEKIAAKNQKKYQTVILGMGGSSPLQQKYIFERKLPELKPEYVIYELYANDPRDDYSFYYSNYMAKMTTYEQFPKWFLNTAIGDRVYTLLSDAASKKNEQIYNSTIDTVENDPAKVWNELTRPSLEAIKQEAERRGAQFYLFNIPLGWEFDNEYATKSAEPRLKQNEFARDWSKEHNVPFVDLYETFLASNSAQLNELYLDGDHGFHLTEKGAEIAADKVFELINK